MATLDVELHRYDDSEIFNLKAHRVEPEYSKGVVSKATQGVLNTVGASVRLDKVDFTIEAKIQGMKSGDYPNSGSYTDHDKGYRDEIARAAEEWAPVLSGGSVQMDELHWAGRTIKGVLTNVQTPEDSERNKAGVYGLSIEWRHFDVFVEF